MAVTVVILIIALLGAAGLVALLLRAKAAAKAQHMKNLAYYRVMANEASDIIMLFENQRVVCASNALTRILGCQPQDIEHGGYLNLVHPDDLEEARKLRGQPKPGEVWTASYRARHADGHYIWLEASTRGAYDEATRKVQEITVTREITERKEHELKIRAAQERAEAANKAKSQFLATMSHELRTPLNAILGFSDILKAEHFGAIGDARYRDYASAINDSGQHLLGLINDILDISKLDTGKLELHLEPVELHPLITECARYVEALAAKTGIRVQIDSETAACTLQVDRRRLRQMLLNLLSNAVKFTPEGGDVRISARLAGAGVAIMVADTGIGMDADVIPKAFERFGQIDSSLSRKYEGTGLGLPLTKQLAELHGAALSLESKPGAGTTVTILFPAESIVADRHVA
jgi:PAS domain S-box-containing protein